MKTTRSLFFCVALGLLASCEDEWFKKDATLAYVVNITDNADGTCTYIFAPSPDDKTGRPMTTECGKWKLRDGIFIAKN